MTKKQLTIEALSKFPNMSKNSIARYLNETYPALFGTLENARQNVKLYTIKRPTRPNQTLIEHKTIHTPQNPFGLPEQKQNERKIAKLPKEATEVLWLSDIHFPNQDNEALTLALQYGLDNNINCIVLGGDILDNEPFTNHLAPPPSKGDVTEWFKMVDDFLLMLRNKFKDIPIVWIEGNHDNWYVRYLMSKAPMLFGDEYYQLENRLKLKDKGIKWYGQSVVLMAGKLQLLHGHTLIKGFFSPVNPARGLFLRAKSSTLIGHCHNTSEHSEANISGEIVTCYSTGCLCTLAPDYDPHNTKHNLGFAHIKLGDKGHFRVLNKRIIKGEIY